LHLAAMASEQDVEAALATLLESKQLPLFSSVKGMVEEVCSSPWPDVHIPEPELSSYDDLLSHLSRAKKEVET
jgi:hypothetical protein